MAEIETYKERATRLMWEMIRRAFVTAHRAGYILGDTRVGGTHGIGGEVVGAWADLVMQIRGDELAEVEMSNLWDAAHADVDSIIEETL